MGRDLLFNALLRAVVGDGHCAVGDVSVGSLDVAQLDILELVIEGLLKIVGIDGEVRYVLYDMRVHIFLLLPEGVELYGGGEGC